MQNFNIVASLCSCTDWFESCAVRNTEDRFSHDEAQLRFPFKDKSPNKDWIFSGIFNRLLWGLFVLHFVFMSSQSSVMKSCADSMSYLVTWYILMGSHGFVLLGIRQYKLFRVVFIVDCLLQDSKEKWKEL